MIHEYDLAIIGGGPAGISAATAAGKEGLKTLLIEERDFLGGQLVKQTHRFFGSREEHAGTRGIHIAEDFDREVSAIASVDIMKESTALGYYKDDGVLTVLSDEKMIKIKPETIILATGAFERFLPFENNDLPGVFGAGAVQTLMNVYGVKPASKVLMIGSGNIGLIVSYQLIQAGVEVAGVVEAAPRIGGYLVHASKLKRLGVPIMTRHTIKAALGDERVRGARLCELDDDWREIAGSESEIDCDAICLAVGLTPLADILVQMGCETKYVPELGGTVPKRDRNLETSQKGVYVAGDLAGIEEASAAMLEGELAALNAVETVKGRNGIGERIEHLRKNLSDLRSGPVGEKIRYGLKALYDESDITEEHIEKHDIDITQLSETGVPSAENIRSCMPDQDRKGKSFAVIECFQEIPCDPCVYSCPFNAISMKDDINDLPVVDFEKCTGCGSCISRCPGLAIFIQAPSKNENKAMLTLPYEMLPKPLEGQTVALLNREGESIGTGVVMRVLDGEKQDKTTVITVEADEELVSEARMIEVMNR